MNWDNGGYELCDEYECSDEKEYSDTVDSDVEVQLYTAAYHQQLDDEESSEAIKTIQTDQSIVDSSVSEQTISQNSKCVLVTDYCEQNNRVCEKKIKSTIKRGPKTRLDNFLLDSTNSAEYQKFSNKNFATSTPPTQKVRINYERVSKLKQDETSSSDSDDDVIVLPAKDRKNIVLNLTDEKGTIFLSDGSEEMLELGDESPNGLWYVDPEDFKKSKSKRYYNNHMFYCYTCDKSGHKRSQCPEKTRKCFICGSEDHWISECNKIICPFCFEKGHSGKTCKTKNKIQCETCGMQGHRHYNCPDIWRRYHSTTVESEIVQANILGQDTPVYCYNCGEKGHFGAVCPSNLTSNSRTRPSVIRYKEPFKRSPNMKNSKASATNGRRNKKPFKNSPNTSNSKASATNDHFENRTCPTIVSYEDPPNVRNSNASTTNGQFEKRRIFNKGKARFQNNLDFRITIEENSPRCVTSQPPRTKAAGKMLRKFNGRKRKWF